MSNTKSRGRGRNHERVKASSKITKKRHFSQKKRDALSWKTDAHRRVHQYRAKSAIKAVPKDLWFRRHSYREAPRV